MKLIYSRVFMNGNSQAVRIPKAFRLASSEVQIFRNADGDLVLRQPKPPGQKRGDALMRTLARFDNQFLLSLEQSRKEAQPVIQNRDAL